MYRLIQGIVGFFIVLIGLPDLNAQIISGTPTNTSTNEVKYYKGRIDDISDVTVSLTFDRNNCKGELVYLRSKDKFRLQGSRKDDLLQLKEFNQENKVTGYFNGKIEGTTIRLDWRNKSEIVGHSLSLEEVARQPDFPTFCGNNKWISAYKGRMKNKDISILLQRVDNNRILGHAYFENDREKMLIRGYLSANQNLNLNFFKENTLEDIGTLRGIFKEKQNLRVSFYNTQNVQEFVSLKLEKSLNVSCLEYADYYTNYDFLFPKSEDAIFNEVMVLLTKDWIEECRKHSQQSRKKTADVASRASQRAYSWTDIELLTDDFISGMLTYHTTWSEQERTKTFNYDLTTNSVIELKDIFKKGFNYQSFVKKYISEEIKKEAIYKHDAEFRKWITIEEFPFFTIGKDGISFFTEFHFIYGRQRVLIPYKKMKSNIRKNAPVKGLM